MDKSADAFRTISEAAEELEVPQPVRRFWETRFSQIKPMKRGGGRRYYRPDDMELLRSIRHLLYGEGYTIRGVQRLLKERGVRSVIALRVSGGLPPMPPETPADRAAEVEDALDEAAMADGPLGDSVADGLPAAMVDVLRAALGDVMEAQRILRAARAT